MVHLKAENITKKYEGEKVISDISIELHEGEIVSLLGVSGGGKTTLFNVLSGLSQPDEGKVFLSEKDITGKPGNISYMLQKDLLLPYYTTLHNVALPLIIKGEKKKEAYLKAQKLFSFFGLEGTEKKFPHQLSGGMRQRAAFLRTYLSSEGVALLDEPFSALDTITKASVHEWYLKIMEEIRLSTLFITHDIEEAILLSDRVYILSGKPGRITDEIKIDLPKPRSNSIVFTEEFNKYKKLISEKIISDFR
ncbi:MAG: ABC transporter ATP-binding protein [Clostridia bacterium]|nr:ABC transporter ATP-binding protein [Clostridia bacterium]MBQ1967225.1 ABC transporter ATP-binding protein [Clostridia bacterium]MBQ1994928.1 ABC transporter ATP-binding protein [Clostridia bacterium]MBQ5904541.1 ABC transporter ATP-binding protein [Clostridia bacterium]